MPSKTTITAITALVALAFLYVYKRVISKPKVIIIVRYYNMEQCVFCKRFKGTWTALKSRYMFDNRFSFIEQDVSKVPKEGITSVPQLGISFKTSDNTALETEYTYAGQMKFQDISQHIERLYYDYSDSSSPKSES